MTGLALAAFGLGLALCAPPGVVFAETVRRGLGRGVRAALGVQMVLFLFVVMMLDINLDKLKEGF